MDRFAGSRTCRSDAAAPTHAFHLLLQLYAHQDVVKELYSSYDAHAAEFEFYIPQLCTFLMHGNYDKQHQLECFLMSRSGESLPFAHRLTWFLRSFCDNARTYHSEYLSVTAAHDQDNVDLLTAIGRRAGVPALLMSSGLCVEEVTAAIPDNLERRRWTNFPTDDDELDVTTFETDETFAGHLMRRRNSVQDEARTEEGNSEQISLFRQTPRFVEALTDLAKQLIPIPRHRRNSKLRKELMAIHQRMLPSDVIYLPIGNSCHRVKGIRVDECFTFSTKERVPYFLCVEVLDYSVSSTADPSVYPEKNKSKAGCHQTHVFNLKLPFKKAEAGLETRGNAVDDSPMSSSTSTESEVSLAASPSAVSLSSEFEKGEGSVAGLPTFSKEVDDTLIGHPLDDGNDENSVDENEEGNREARAIFAENEGSYRAEEAQQDRLGQWNLPRPVPHSVNEYSSSAPARSGGQFENFYSSWFLKKGPQDDDEEEDGIAWSHSESNGMNVGETAEIGAVAASTFRNDPSCVDEGADGAGDGETEVQNSDSVPASLSSKHADIEVAVPQPDANANTMRQTEPERDRAPVDCDHAGNDTSKVVGSETTPAPTQAAGPLPSTVPKSLTDDMTSTCISDEAPPSSKKEAKCGATSKANGGKGNTVKPIVSVGILGSIFAKKSQKGTKVSTEVLAKPDEAACLPRADAQNACGDRTSASSVELSESGVTDDSCGQDADDEDTDSNRELVPDNDHVACKAENSAATLKPAEKQASFTSWFYRKPTPSMAGPTDKSAGATPRAGDKAVPSVAVDSDLCTPKPTECIVEDEDIPQEEPRFQQRPRDLSVSLDFADPTAWKEKFDLEDGVTGDGSDAETVDRNTMCDDDESEQVASDDEDEKPMIVFRERWSDKEARIRSESPYGDHPGWRLLSVIVKSNDDLRQEQFAAQLIAQCDRIFREYSLPLLLRPYNVIATSATTGLIEAVPDTVSLDSLKRNDPGYTSLLDFYTRLHGDKDTAGFARAQRNFVESLAAYSVVCYVFQIKDRHNGNILVDTDGRVIHIDFGFFLTNSPGSNWNFERAPFKLTDEFVELMGGPRSSTFRYFRSLCIRAYLALRRNMDRIVLLVEMMLVGNADLPCFAGGKKAVIEGLRSRLKPGARTSACQMFVNQLIDQSMNNWRTRWYDKYQRACLGIL
ncbi:unnamed protein product [Hyaloperonospora brassicae]|uniref:1-phosphatidylinositol 4-kinase n=1 Tax=Hyaloperonospora brassicae TaxID=162125 RepID=A0AAV0UIJ8_HYABA|nr:unnamed protein product [Hyaloperonospora brassicae]